MPGLMATAHRSARAEIDLIEIWVTSRTTIRSRQIGSSTCLTKPARCLAAIRTRAQSRDDLARGLRFFPVGNHLVFYTVRDDGITVVRVLHGARDYRDDL